MPDFRELESTLVWAVLHGGNGQMNMNHGIISRDEMKGLLSAADDDGAHHVLWVGEDGTVHLDPVPAHMSAAGYAEGLQARFRLKASVRGKGYTGPIAAANEGYVDKICSHLETLWAKGTRGYVDSSPHGA